MKYQPNIPTDLYNKFIENLGYTPKGEKILVIRDIYTACYLSINNEVTFVSDDSEAISMFINTVIVNPEFGTDDSYIFVKENANTEWLNTIDRIVKSMKFDVAIMNPPYDGDLHLKILEKVISVTNKVVNISPIDWLMNPYGGSVSKRFKDLKITNIENIGLLKNIFDGLERCTYTGGIYLVDETASILPEEYLYKFVSVDYNNYINETYLANIIAKTIKCDNLENHIKCGEISNTTNYTIILPRLVGNPNKKVDRLYYRNSRWDKIFYNGLYNGKTPSETKKKLSNVKNYTIFDYIEFNTKNEAENWINAGETKFIRFMQLIQSVDANRRCKYTPWMSDYTQPWTDKRFCEHFGITGYIDDEHAEPDSEWEIILKTIEQYEK